MSPGQASGTRLYQIDLLRFIAAFMVVVYHYAFRGYAGDDLSTMPYPLLADMAKYGHLGVNLFFIISGFVILMTAANGSTVRFAISRIVRLYPAFWACCTMTFLVTLAFGGVRYQASIGQYLVNMTMLSGFVGVPSIDGVYWSLFVEMQFYLCIIGVLLLGWINRAEMLVSLWLAGSLLTMVWPAPFLSRLLMPEFCPLFVAGAVFYLVHRTGVTTYRLFILGVCYLFAARNAIARAKGVAPHYGVVYSDSAIAVIVLIFFAIMALISIGKAGWLNTSRWLSLGALTYPLYLIHHNVGFIIINTAYPMVNPHVVLMLTTTVVLVCAVFVNVAVERKLSPKLKGILERYLVAKPQSAAAHRVGEIPG